MLDQLQAFDLELKGKLPDYINPEELFRPVGNLSVAESLNLYKINQREGKYKVLCKFFELCEAELGEQEFRRIALGFIKRFPSPTFTLSGFHPKFPGFLAANSGEKEALIYDLARFEWRWHRLGRTDWREPDADILQKLQGLDPEKVRFLLSPSVRVERFEHRIFDVFKMRKAGEEATYHPGKNFVVFWRSAPTAKNRRMIKLWQAHLLKLMLKNKDLTLAVANITRHSKVHPDEVSMFINELIQEKLIVGVR